MSGFSIAEAMAYAFEQAERSPDPFFKVGAVVMTGGLYLASGFNQPGVPGVDLTDRESRRGLMVHAEVVALCKLPIPPREPRRLVVTVMPCEPCLTMSAFCGVTEVVYGTLPDPERYPLEASHRHAERLGLDLWQQT